MSALARTSTSHALGASGGSRAGQPHRRRIGWILLGVGFLQLAWMFVIPPFEGSDEFDHAYRAAAAARGQIFVEPTAATRGTGALVVVPDDLVRAAHPACTKVSYTTDRECVGRPQGDDVLIPTGAGRYHPLFYAVVGTVALPFSGSSALLAMRAATALLALGFLALALVSIARWARGPWPFTAAICACTPVVIYSASVAAPNGVEMMAALALWSALIGLATPGEHPVRLLTLVASLSGATLATLRPLGPLWCLLVAGTVILAIGPTRARAVALLSRRGVLIGAFVVLVAAIQSTVWIIAMDALKLGVAGGPQRTLGFRAVRAAQEIPAWIFQSIAAFPLRDNPTHPVVYACYLILFVAFLVLGVPRAGRRVRVAIAVVALVSLAFPLLTTIASYNTFSTAWQGRYGLPYAMGMVLLAGWALDRTGGSLRGPLYAGGAALFVIAQTLSLVHTLGQELRLSPLAGTGAWIQPWPVVILGAGATASMLVWWSASRATEPTS